MSWLSKLLGHGGHYGGGHHGSKHGSRDGYGHGGYGTGQPYPERPAAAGRACISCGLINTADARFCQQCGKSFATAVSCQKCSAPLAPEAKFCAQCGTAKP